ncbi:MAG: glycoside hydrolase family 125 protein [Chloroflexi bacterium]|nr:glycoside hydrolase family 125 protein [Chloroflexota bacterium]
MKPLDAGTGRLCASFDVASGGWLSLGAPHERHGFVELSALPPFDEGSRGDPDATRRYRLEMTLARHAFLSVEVDGARPALTPDASDPARPRWAGTTVTVEVEAVPEASVIRQRWEFGPGFRPDVRIVARGRIDRPALAEITELDPPEPTGAVTNLAPADAAMRWDAPMLPADAAVSVFGCRVAWRSVGSDWVGTITWPAETNVRSFTLEMSLEPLSATPGAPPSRHETTGDRLTDRALTYVRGCTALRVAVDERTILTDHRMLPLSWTRDAYWQALALLAADGPGDRERVADHLRWLWRRCERPNGRWVRSHHANGRRKDLAFQADQQLYPLVELADYWRLTDTLPDGVGWSSEVTAAWAAARERVDSKSGLIASAENAADDPAPAPYIGSSQILLWYAAHRIAEVAEQGGLSVDVGGLHSAAAEVHAAFDAAFSRGGPWPYAVDGDGHRTAYHDANDLPVVLAPLWGFCAPAHPGWEATMAFAFSGANPAWVTGPRSGLGSTHTPGTWTLGDVQAWAHARIVGDTVAADAAVARLEDVSFADGMLPEAYGATDDLPVRHWFAWPGAALATLRLLDAAGQLNDRLIAEAIRRR